MEQNMFIQRGLRLISLMYKNVSLNGKKKFRLQTELRLLISWYSHNYAGLSNGLSVITGALKGVETRGRRGEVARERCDYRNRYRKVQYCQVWRLNWATIQTNGWPLETGREWKQAFSELPESHTARPTFLFELGWDPCCTSNIQNW